MRFGCLTTAGSGLFVAHVESYRAGFGAGLIRGSFTLQVTLPST